jgi:tetrahydromethanopterin S-methyltransferase subunit B
VQPPQGIWVWVPIIRDPEMASVTAQLEEIMGAVQVQQAQLDELDQSLDDATSSLEEKINALNLPKADLQPLLDDVEKLRGLSAPAADDGGEELPPAGDEEPV